MIKILVVDSQKLDGVGWWRNARPFGIMRRQFRHDIDIRQVTEAVDVREIMGADVVVMFRPSSEKSLGFVQLCKQLGCKVILDVDDDLWNLDPHHPAFQEFEGMRDTSRAIFDAADYIWTSTKQLMFAADCFGRGEVMQNAVLPSELPKEAAEWKGKGIACWRGFNNQVSDVLSDHAREWYRVNVDRFDRWQFAGYLPDLPHGPNVQFVRKTDPLAYFLNLQRTGANVIWKPLKDCKFNDAKSNIAWIEATMIGACCVTNYAKREGWEYALPDFPETPEEARLAWALSAEEIQRNYNLLEVNERRFKSILKVLGAV